MVSIIDYGMGNIGSLENMILKVGGSSIRISTRLGVEEATKLLLPGVGNFDNAIKRLHDLDLWDAIDHRVKQDKVPILCICLGAQLATGSSEEGSLPGFGWFDASTKRFSADDNRLKIPHMGWNDVEIYKKSRIVEGLPHDACFYFVHSYYISANDPADVMMKTVYGVDFVSGLERDNVYAFQFHPEKSHRYGMTIVRNFVEL